MRNPKNKNRKNRFAELFAVFVRAIVYSTSQPKTETKATEGSNLNKDAPTSGQGHAHPKTAGPVCIPRDDRSRRDNSLFIRRNERTMHLNRRSYQRGSVS